MTVITTDCKVFTKERLEFVKTIGSQVKEMNILIHLVDITQDELGNMYVCDYVKIVSSSSTSRESFNFHSARKAMVS